MHFDDKQVKDGVWKQLADGFNPAFLVRRDVVLGQLA
jgi:hypothetical protein